MRGEDAKNKEYEMNRLFNIIALAVLTCLLFVPVAGAGWMDKLENMGEEAGIVSGASAALTDEEIVAGLKDALRVGADNTVSFLGRPGGYLNHEAVRIPLPEHMDPAAKVARTIGKGELVDEFVTSMNRAAEQAAPEALDVFLDTISGMTFKDARKILNGPDDAATRYFERNTSEELTRRFMPIVKEATNEVGATRKYKNFTEGMGPAGEVLDTDAMDLDAYVTDKALDGMFFVLAREEKKIREDPAARTTEILQKVFGAASGQ
jgi:hypothetical protein